METPLLVLQTSSTYRQSWGNPYLIFHLRYNTGMYVYMHSSTKICSIKHCLCNQYKYNKSGQGDIGKLIIAPKSRNRSMTAF